LVVVVVVFLLEKLDLRPSYGIAFGFRVTYRKTGMIENLARTLELPLLVRRAAVFFLLVSTEDSFHLCFFSPWTKG